MAIKQGQGGEKDVRVIDDNVIQPFRLERCSIRGRMIRLGQPLQEITRLHNYPAPVSYLLSEVISMCLLLGAMLKYEGIFSLQVKGDGPVRTLAADVTHDGRVRAFAGFDHHAVKKLARRKEDKSHNYYSMLGNGHMAFTVDQGVNMERYQGLVQLEGKSIVDCVQHYFDQSEQIRTNVQLAIHPQDDQWRAGAIMIQQMPDTETDTETVDEDWRRCSMLLETVRDDELVSHNLHSADILYRLFHEEGVIIYPPTPVRHACRCSREKVISVLASLPHDESRAECAEKGKLEITCEFCSRVYEFDAEQLEEVFALAEGGGDRDQ